MRKCSKPLTLLALSPNRFRGNLKVLSKEFRIIRFSSRLQSRINHFFIGEKKYENHFKERPDKLLSFIKKILFILKWFGVNAIISSAIHNQMDYYWGWAGEEIGIPYIVIHRENAIYSEGGIKKHIEKWGKIGKFKGSLVITENELVNSVLKKCGFTEKTKTCGRVELDNYIKQVKETYGIPKSDVW